MTGTRTSRCPPLVTPLCTVLYRYNLAELTESAAPPYAASHPRWGGALSGQLGEHRLRNSESPGHLVPSICPRPRSGHNPRNLELVAVVQQGIARETTLELRPLHPWRLRSSAMHLKLPSLWMESSTETDLRCRRALDAFPHNCRSLCSPTMLQSP